MTSKPGHRHIVPVVVAVVCAMAAFGPQCVRACGSPPPSFSEEIEYSEVIMVGRVTGIELRTIQVTGEYDYEYTDEIATVEVEETILGAVERNAPITIHEFGEEDVPDGARLMIFAARNASNELESRIVRDVSDLDALEDFVNRIREFLEIRTLPEEDQGAAFIEWVIKCVEHDATRMDGVEELYRLGYSRWLPSQDGQQDADPLSLGQRERLTSLLLSTDDVRAVTGIAGFLERYDDPRVANHLLRIIELKAPSASEEVGWLMSIVSDQLDWRTGKWLADAYSRSDSRKARPALARRFLSLEATLGEIPEAVDPDPGEFADAASEAVRRYASAAEHAEAAFAHAADEQAPGSEQAAERRIAVVDAETAP